MTIADMLKKHGWEQGLVEGIEQGIEQGALATKRENAVNMLRLGSDLDFVCKVTGLTADEVARLADSLVPRT